MIPRYRFVKYTEIRSVIFVQAKFTTSPRITWKTNPNFCRCSTRPRTSSIPITRSSLTSRSGSSRFSAAASQNWTKPCPFPSSFSSAISARTCYKSWTGSVLGSIVEEVRYALRLIQTTVILLLPATNAVCCSKNRKIPINHNAALH